MEQIKKYIVIDDDPTSNLICEFVIKKKVPGADVKLFNEPAEALDYIENNKDPEPVVVFLDINMPTMTGWEFLDVFKKLDPELQERFRIYILSSSVEDSTREAITYPFVQEFLSKPLSNAHMDALAKRFSDEKVEQEKD